MQGRTDIYLEECLDITHQLLKVVSLLHQKDIILLNLSIENILINGQGKIKLTDFSACYIQGMPETRVSAYRNKLATVYAAPEFLSDDKSGCSADIFSISVIAYKLMTHSLPYSKEYLKCTALQDYYKLKYQAAFKVNPMIPDWLESVLKKGLSLVTRQRFNRAEDMILALKSPNSEQHEASPLHEPSNKAWQVFSCILLFTQAITLIWLFA